MWRRFLDAIKRMFSSNAPQPGTPARSNESSPGPTRGMDVDRFWTILEQSHGDAERVASMLSKLTKDEIASFQKLYYDHHNRLHKWDVWAAAYVINGGCSDDGFHYFKAWVIGKGRKAYETALNSPDDLGPFVTDADADMECDNESLNYAAIEAWEKVAGKGAELERNSIEGSEPEGEPFDEDTVYERFPKLAAKFG